MKTFVTNELSGPLALISAKIQGEDKKKSSSLLIASKIFIFSQIQRRQKKKSSLLIAIQNLYFGQIQDEDQKNKKNVFMSNLS